MNKLLDGFLYLLAGIGAILLGTMGFFFILPHFPEELNFSNATRIIESLGALVAFLSIFQIINLGMSCLFMAATGFINFIREGVSP